MKKTPIHQQFVLSRRSALAATAVSLFPGIASAASETDPIRVVIPYPAGGGTDVIGRLVASTVSKELNQSMIPENRGGADGLIGIRVVAQAKPDGSVLGISGIGTSVTLALTSKNMPYLIGRDLEAIAHLGGFGNMIVVGPQSPHRDLNSLLKTAKEGAKPLSCGTPAKGSPSYITLQYLCATAKVDITSISYQGHSQIMTDLLGGHLDMALLSVPIARSAIESGQLKALAVTSADRSSVLPQIPTASESGLPGFDASLWNVLVTAKGPSEEAIEKLNRATNKAFSSPGATETLRKAGVDFRPYSVAETRAFVSKEKARWEAITKAAGLQAT